jgi:hypothetical protein
MVWWLGQASIVLDTNVILQSSSSRYGNTVLPP